MSLSGNPRLMGFRRRLAAGEVLFNEGDTGTALFILVDGQVEVLRHDQRIALVDGKEAFLGEIASLTRQPRSATVRAITPCTFVAVDDAMELLRADPVWGLRLAQVLAARLLRIEQDLDGIRTRASAKSDVDTVRVVTELVNSLATAMRPGLDPETDTIGL